MISGLETRDLFQIPLNIANRMYCLKGGLRFIVIATGPKHAAVGANYV